MPLTEEQVRRIIREELQSLIAPDRLTFQKHIQVFDGRNIHLGKTNGTKIGTEATQKLAFFAAAPVVQQAHIAGPSGGTTISAFPFTLADNEARNAVNSILLVLQRMGFMAP